MAILIENSTVKRDLAVQCGNLVGSFARVVFAKCAVCVIFAKEVVAARGKFAHAYRQGIWLPEGGGHLQAELEAKKEVLGWLIWIVIGLLDSVIEANLTVIEDFNSDLIN